MSALAALSTIAPALYAADQTWDGGSITNGNWSTLANWNGDSAAPGRTSVLNSGDVATFNAAIANTWGNATGNPVAIDSTTQNISGISFTQAAGSYFLGTTAGNSLLLSSGGTIQILSGLTSTNAIETINAPLQIQGASSATYSILNNSANGAGVGAGTLNIGGGITGVATATNTTTLTLGGTNANLNAISGVIGNGAAGGSLALTKSGSGLWTLSANNTYTGATTINAGTLRLNNGFNSKGITGDITVNSGSALAFTGYNQLGTTFNSTAPTNTVTVNSGGVLSWSNNVQTFNNLTLNNNALTLTGGYTFPQWGALVILNTLTATGTSSINTAVGGNSNFFISPGTVTGGANRTLTVAVTGGGDSLAIAAPIQNYDGSNTYALTKTGAGTLTLSGNNTYTGKTTVSAGTLALTGSGTISTSSPVVVAASATFDTVGLTTAGTLNAATVSVNASSNGVLNLKSGTAYANAFTIDFGSSSTLASSYNLITTNLAGHSGNFSSVIASGTSISGTFLTGSNDTWTLISGGYNLVFSEQLGTLTASAIPEPSTYAAFTGALALLTTAFRRRRR